MALTVDGFIYTWGRGTDGQLGRRFSPRVVDWKKEGLLPRKVAGLKNVVDIGSGSNHSFAVERSGLVYGWGFNNAGQIGVVDNAGEYESAYGFAITVAVPSLVKSLVGLPPIKQITGGNFRTSHPPSESLHLPWAPIASSLPPNSPFPCNRKDR
jgi:regulator of chromosome condensation